MLLAKPLRDDTFKPFGQVIPLRQQGVYRNDHAAELANGIPQALPRLSIARRPAAKLPVSLTALERHRFSSQTFLPSDLARYLVVVCAQDDAGLPDIGALRAFVGNGDQGISYLPGVWHGPMTVLDRDGEYASLRWCANDARDNELYTLPVAIEIATGSS